MANLSNQKLNLVSRLLSRGGDAPVVERLAGLIEPGAEGRPRASPAEEALRDQLARTVAHLRGGLLPEGGHPAGIPTHGPERPPAPPRPRTEVLWDRFGVPHIFAPDVVSAARAFGWSQARSHGNLLLTLFGRARGRAAEYLGGRRR